VNVPRFSFMALVVVTRGMRPPLSPAPVEPSRAVARR